MRGDRKVGPFVPSSKKGLFLNFVFYKIESREAALADKEKKLVPSGASCRGSRRDFVFHSPSVELVQQGRIQDMQTVRISRALSVNLFVLRQKFAFFLLLLEIILQVTQLSRHCVLSTVALASKQEEEEVEGDRLFAKSDPILGGDGT